MTPISATIKPLRLFGFLTACAVTIAVGTSLYAGRGDVIDPVNVDSGIRPVLTVDPAAKIMKLQMANTDIWELAFAIQDTAEPDVDRFFASLAATARSEPLLVENRHMYRGTGEYHSAELQAVAEELKVDPVVLQRMYPGRMALVLPGSHILEIYTDSEAPTLSESDNLCFDMMRFAEAPFSEHCLRIEMEPVDALTLFHAAAPGLPVAVHF